MFHPHGPTFFELAVQALSSTQRGYDLLAPKFDVTPFRTPQMVLDAIAEKLRERRPFRAGLDICCGTGAGLAMLRPLCAERVVGLDFSRVMLAVARQNLEHAPGQAALEFVQGEALRLPFPADQFDIATCFGALGHIERRDERRFVGEIARVLRPGGCFAFVTGERPPFWSLGHWAARGFNTAMRLRNLLIQPPFVMYYLTFLLPGVLRLLSQAGLNSEVIDLGLAKPLTGQKLVVAVKTA
jgi:ubiquinone/menaquinone biosynthesis C-methylase UbiE